MTLMFAPNRGIYSQGKFDDVENILSSLVIIATVVIITLSPFKVTVFFSGKVLAQAIDDSTRSDDIITMTSQTSQPWHGIVLNSLNNGKNQNRTCQQTAFGVLFALMIV